MGIVEPRVVVKIPLTKLSSPSTKSSQQDDGNVTKTLSQKRKKGKKSSKKRYKKILTSKLIEQSGQMEPDQTIDLLLDNTKVVNISGVRISRNESRYNISKYNDEVNKEIVLKDSGERLKDTSSSNNSLFGGVPIFDNELKVVTNTYSKDSLNESDHSIKQADRNQNSNTIDNYKYKCDITTPYEKNFTDSNLVQHDLNIKNNPTTEDARCILTMQDEGKQHRITQSRNMIYQSKQQAKNINNTPNTKSIPNPHIDKSKEQKSTFNDEKQITVNQESRTESIKPLMFNNVPQKFKTNSFNNPFVSSPPENEILLKENEQNKMNINAPHLSFADLANKGRKNEFLEHNEAQELCGLIVKHKDDDACFPKNCHPKNLQLHQNSTKDVMSHHIIRDNKTIILRKSKFNPNIISTPALSQQNHENTISSSLMEQCTVATAQKNKRRDEGELLCSNKGKYVDGNAVVCSSSQITKSIQKPPPYDKLMPSTTGNVFKRTNGLFTTFNSLSNTINKDDNFARVAENEVQKKDKCFAKIDNSADINLEKQIEKSIYSDLADKRRNNNTRNTITSTQNSSQIINSNIEDSLCSFKPIKHSVLRSPPANENKEVVDKSFKEHYSYPYHIKPDALNNDVHLANNLDHKRYFSNNTNYKQRENQKQEGTENGTCSEFKSSLSLSSKGNCPERMPQILQQSLMEGTVNEELDVATHKRCNDVENMSEMDDKLEGSSSSTNFDHHNYKGSEITVQKAVLKVARVSSVKFNLNSTDDKWMFCKERGCTFWTRKPERMERHKKCHLPDTKYYKCPDCKEFTKFYSLAKLLKHDRKAHTGVQDYECRVCEAEVTDITVHMKVKI